MRISTAYAQQLAIEGLQERQSQLLRAQEQLAGGRRVGVPSDDPVAAAEAERLRSREARIESERRAASHAKHLLSGAENALTDATGVLQAARDALLASANGSLAPTDRAKFAIELRGLREQLLSVANRADGADGYVFCGQSASVVPFDASGTTYAPVGGTQVVGVEQVNPVRLDGRENFSAIRSGTGSGTENIFVQLDAAIAALENPALTQSTVAQTTGEVIGSIDRATERLAQTRTLVGERLRAIDMHEQALESGSIEAQARMSELVDLDFTRGVAAIVQHQTTYDAALRSYAQIARMTLFDYV